MNTQVQPKFLVIGTPKSGSSWLRTILQSHEDVYIPNDRAEIHYFDRYIKEKPINWYLRFFNGIKEEKIAGEVTPHYLYVEDVTTFTSVPSIEKFIVILRDPVDRCISHYRYRQRIDRYEGSFTRFIEDYPWSLEWGLYGKWLGRFLETYSSEQLHVIIFERAIKNPIEMVNALASFLAIAPEKFLKDVTFEPVNKGFQPKNPIIHSQANKLSSMLLHLELYKTRNFLKKIFKIFTNRKSESSSPLLTKLELENLIAYYEADIRRIHQIIDFPDDCWTNRSNTLPWVEK